jgi:hypothetical protein
MKREPCKGDTRQSTGWNSASSKRKMNGDILIVPPFQGSGLLVTQTDISITAPAPSANRFYRLRRP